MTDTDIRPSPEFTRQRLLFWTGIGLVWAYMIVGATGEVYAAAMFQSVDLYACLLISFVMITVVFNLRSRQTTLPKSRPQIRAFVFLNASTAVAWLGLFIGLKFVEPAIVVSFMVALGPITALVTNALIRSTTALSKVDVMASLMIAAGGVYLVFVIFNGRSGQISTADTALGLVASICAGVALATTSVFVKRLFDLKVEGTAILAHRFYITLGLLMVLVDWNVLVQTLGTYAVQAVLIATLTVIVPILLIQAAIQRLEPFIVNLLLCASPLVTFAVQLFDSRLSTSGYTLIGNAAIVAIAMWTVFVNARRH